MANAELGEAMHARGRQFTVPAASMFGRTMAWISFAENRINFFNLGRGARAPVGSRRRSF
jgi:hypothetical protein